MLRALTSYFFGGIEDETPEAPVECETREVNDWLVVNLPDQNKDSINLNDDDDMYEIDDDDIRNELDDDDIRNEMDDEDVGSEMDDEDIRNEMDDEDDAVEVDSFDTNDTDSDEDDILLSVSVLMMPPDTEKLSSEFSNDQYRFGSRPVDERPYGYAEFFRRILETTDRKDIIAAANYSKRMHQLVLPLRLAIQPSVKATEADFETVTDVMESPISLAPQRNEIVSEFERKDKINFSLVEPALYFYSKHYVNHRHPAKALNHELLQRIKELEPEQQTIQRSAKKILTRGQLNRQNKNYMYETSSKKNRRSNRQRNHSGANNNRKC